MGETDFTGAGATDSVHLPRSVMPQQIRTSDLLTSHPQLLEWSIMPPRLEYSSVQHELSVMRSAATVGDMSLLIKYEIKGDDAARFVDMLVTKDTSSLEPGEITFSPWCNDEGHLINDGLIFRVSEDTYRISSDWCIEWFRHVAERVGGDVDVIDVSTDWGILALQGPRSTEVLERATKSDWGDLSFSRRVQTEIAGAVVDLARQGFTGEVGYEIWVQRGDGPRVLDAVLEAGDGLGLEPAGILTADVARVEAGLALPVSEYSPVGPDDHFDFMRTPEYRTSVLVPYSRFVDLDKPDFIGRDALLEEQRSGVPSEQLVGLRLDWRALSQLFEEKGQPAAIRAEVLRTPMAVQVEGARVGRANSVTWSPTIEQLIGFGVIAREHSEIGTQLAVAWERDGADGLVPATVVEIPFIEVRRAD
jgi:aminomethyltransferase